MKKLYFIYAILLLSAFTSCKKEGNQQISTTITKPVIPPPLHDSVSYTIDGKTYTTGGVGISNTNAGFEEPDRKLTINNVGYSLIGNQDSIMYFQESKMFSANANIDIYFVKKFIKNPQAFFYWPGLNGVLTIFTVGKQPYAADFGWQNAENGIAMNVVANNKVYTSYNAYNGINTVVFPPGFEKNSTFEITSFTKITAGYALEAKFTAVVIDNTTGEQKQLTGGYIRLVFSPSYANNS